MYLCIVVYSLRFPSSQQLKLHQRCSTSSVCPSVRVALLASRDITVVVAERKKISRALGFDKMALLVEDFFCLQILSCPKTTSPNLTKLWAASNCVWKRRPPDFKTTTHQTTKRIRSMAEAQM